jgi:hypothetical protein
MVETDEYLATLTSEVCPNCGIMFAMPDTFKDAKRNDHSAFYCPNGHSLSYNGKSETERLKQQLQWAEASKQSWRDQAETAENRRRAQKAANTKLKKRIANGVCPCCSRNFQDLRRHMAGQHPDYAEPKDV